MPILTALMAAFIPALVSSHGWKHRAKVRKRNPRLRLWKRAKRRMAKASRAINLHFRRGNR